MDKQPNIKATVWAIVIQPFTNNGPNTFTSINLVWKMANGLLLFNLFSTLNLSIYDNCTNKYGVPSCDVELFTLNKQYK